MMEDGITVFCRLKRLDLTFEERIYAIVFNLTDDISWLGKEAIFAELECRDRMSEYIQNLFIEAERASYCAKILQEAFSYTAVEEIQSRENEIEQAIDYFRKGYDAQCDASFRRYLLGRECSRQDQETTSNSSLNTRHGRSGVISAQKLEVDVLFEQIQKLAAEVRYHDQQRDRAFEEIKALFGEIKALDNCPKEAKDASALNILQGGEIELQGSVTQIHWPYRSWRVLQKLKIETVKQAADYFTTFTSLAESDEMTLWEWAVIAATLRREKLLSNEGKTAVQLSDKLADILNLSDGDGGRIRIRSSNALLRANIFTVRDLLCYFANSMKDGWWNLSRVRDFGKTSQKFLSQLISDWEIIIPPEYCEPTRQTAVEALDFSRQDLEAFKEYQVVTIDELSEACHDTNRFSGMCHNNPELYETAVRRLTDYGFFA